MLHSLNERKITMRSERKRMWCPTLPNRRPEEGRLHIKANFTGYLKVYLVITAHLPNVAEGKVDENPDDSDHLELKMGRNLEVHPLGKVLRST